MLLIFVVLLTTFAVSYPSLDRLYKEHQLRQAVQQVQVRLAAARVRAVDSGLTYQLRYEPSGRHFLVVPYDQEATADVAGSVGAVTGQQAVVWKHAGTLVDTVRFDGSPAGTTGFQQIPAEWLSYVAEPYEFQNLTWSLPMLFYPDGSSSGGMFDIIDRNQQFVRLSVRALTGGVTVSKVENGATR